MSTQTEILERVLKDLRYYQQYGAKVILETAIFDLEQTIKEPPASKPLTGEEMNQIEARWDASMHGSKIAFVVRETEAAHGIKENT